MPSSIPWRHHVDDAISKRHHTHGIALMIQKPSQRCGERFGIFDFSVFKRSKSHRPAQVDKQVTTQIRFVFKSLDIVTVAAGKQLPIKVSQVVANGVLAIVGELNRKSMVGASVKPRHKSLNDNFRAKLKVLDTHDRFRRNARSGSRGRLKFGDRFWVRH